MRVSSGPTHDKVSQPLTVLSPEFHRALPVLSYTRKITLLLPFTFSELIKYLNYIYTNPQVMLNSG